MDERFVLVGARTPLPPPVKTRKWYEGRPVVSMAVLAGIVLGCLFCGAFVSGEPGYMDLLHSSEAPGGEFWFGTDTPRLHRRRQGSPRADQDKSFIHDPSPPAARPPAFWDRSAR